MIATADLLSTIVAATRRVVEVRQGTIPASVLERQGTRMPLGGTFAAALRHSTPPRVIAECKRRSPSKGILRADYDPAAHASDYAAAGAAAISVLTEPTFFDGSLDHLAQVRAVVEIPILRKDFVVSEYQLLEAVALGADAVLLIAGALTDEELLRLRARATALGLALKIRILALLLLLIGAALQSRLPRAATAVATLAGAVALATLAWSGHGAAGEGSAGWLQLAADLIHLFAAGAWVGAIAAFFALAIPSIRSDEMERVSLAERALRGFAGIGTLIVGLLILTGAVNGFFLVGPDHVAALAQSTYGLLLIAKLLLFAVMLGLAGLNRFRLTPALGLAIAHRDAAAAMVVLRRSLLVEGILALVILALVAWLGTLSPPMSA